MRLWDIFAPHPVDHSGAVCAGRVRGAGARVGAQLCRPGRCKRSRAIIDLSNMFQAAMDSAARATTENGDSSLNTTSDALLDAFYKLCRGCSEAEAKTLVMALFDGLEGEENCVMCADAFVLWASTRDVRGGKGEREIGNWMLISLSKIFPEIVMKMLEFLPEYGSWKDVFLLLANEDISVEMADGLVELTRRQLEEDLGGERPSLCAKWAPRPKSAQSRVAKRLAAAMFPEEKHPCPPFRKMLATLNKRLQTVEIAMAGGDWSSIVPASVPSQCLVRNRGAFLNKPVKKRRTNATNAADREKCAATFTQHALLAASEPSKARVHGRALHPHQMVKHYMKRSPEEDVILEAQWADMRERLRNEMPNLGKMVPLCDVSGSMSGVPMEVSIALGVLISEISTIRDRFMTFSSTPAWHVMQPDWSLKEKVQSAMGAHWEMSTNFEKALDLLLGACVAGGVPPAEVGELSLVVLSDMQFDAAGKTYGHQQGGGWDTQYERLVKRFERAGVESEWKQPYPVPRIVFWNLRGDTCDFPVDASADGVACVSGFSPNLLKAFMQGEAGPAAAAPVAATPYEVMRCTLDDPRYQAVRDTCAEYMERHSTK